MTAADARSQALATQARRVHTEVLLRGLPSVVATLTSAVQDLLSQPAEHALQMARRDAFEAWQRCATPWHARLGKSLRHVYHHGPGDSRSASLSSRPQNLSLVDDDTIEREIIASRLALAMMDKASWEFSDLRNRMQRLEGLEDLPHQDLLRAQVLARLVLDAWFESGLSSSVWQMLQRPLHQELSQLLLEAYHDANHLLLTQGVMPEVDLRPLIRRNASALPTSAASAAQAGHAAAQVPAGGAPTPAHSAHSGHPAHPTHGAAVAAGIAPQAAVQAQSGTPALTPATQSAQQVMAQLQRVLARHVPELARGSASASAPTVPARPSQMGAGPGRATVTGVSTTQMGAPLSRHAAQVPHSQRLGAAINMAQETVQRRVEQAEAPGVDIHMTAPQALDEIRQRNQTLKSALKQAADTPAERATIELVALLFQAILQEERIPPALRVWFARLQMPVLRVAIGEPDFFAAEDHPARRLIDRMGACVMGFSASAADIGDALEREIKRVVQVVEAYPDTGRRVFQTVLTEFEKFLDHYFQQENEVSRKGVSLAQQVEQRETLAIQYTIELRKMLSEVPVQDGVRDFLFQIWADVLAVTGVRYGPQADQTKLMKRAAADLIWSASAKVSREDRAEVIRRLPPLLKTLRDGMGHAGMTADRQDEQIRSLNNALAAAFTAKTAAIPRERLDELMSQLETLEAMLPSTEAGVEINESLVRDLSSHEVDGLEVVAEGGTPPTPAMLAWARELQVGSWYMLDYRNRVEPVQLVWRGMRHHLILFVSPHGRGVLFQLSRLGAFLQAGLMLPAQDESLTVKATRNALAKLEVDPTRLLA
ncbi:DUF1631 family protein [Roseateles depolymerans]|uniref:Uncharacterized protein n=1 Tax=Roseateles depolymerans TaxID=76731 RepID=A0A0U3MCG0_9BURK|nr:DUF1631 family protein [Roseateles depolymerans]ALV05100.1 hypothetical protein RD2015_602 [Roseateles depolymerans]REG14886.1 uncharacterized protein DUF1631 [Roseateles depolymerans]